MGREGLGREASSRLNYHATQLAEAGALTIEEESPVYRSQLADDPAVLTYLEVTAEADARAADG
jgi:hypothetical protein